jgi:hypothetical protein
MLNPADIVISPKQGTGAALLAKNTSEDGSFARAPKAEGGFLEISIRLDIPTERVDTAMKDGGLDNKSAEDALLSLSSTSVFGAILETGESNPWDSMDDVVTTTANNCPYELMETGKMDL